MVGLRDLRNFFLLIQTFYSPLSLFCRSLRLLHGASPHIQCLRQSVTHRADVLDVGQALSEFLQVIQ